MVQRAMPIRSEPEKEPSASEQGGYSQSTHRTREVKVHDKATLQSRIHQ